MLVLAVILGIGACFWLMFWMLWVRGEKGHHKYREPDSGKTAILIGFLALLLVAAIVFLWAIKR